MGRAVLGNPRESGLELGLYGIVGLGFAIAFAILITVGQSIRLFSRHTSCHGLCGVSPSAPYAPSVLGNCRAHLRLYCHGTYL